MFWFVVFLGLFFYWILFFFVVNVCCHCKFDSSLFCIVASHCCILLSFSNSSLFSVVVPHCYVLLSPLLFIVGHCCFLLSCIITTIQLLIGIVAFRCHVIIIYCLVVGHYCFFSAFCCCTFLSLSLATSLTCYCSFTPCCYELILFFLVFVI